MSKTIDIFETGLNVIQGHIQRALAGPRMKKFLGQKFLTKNC